MTMRSLLHPPAHRYWLYYRIVTWRDHIVTWRDHNVTRSIVVTRDRIVTSTWAGSLKWRCDNTKVRVWIQRCSPSSLETTWRVTASSHRHFEVTMWSLVTPMDAAGTCCILQHTLYLWVDYIQIDYIQISRGKCKYTMGWLRLVGSFTL